MLLIADNLRERHIPTLLITGILARGDFFVVFVVICNKVEKFGG